MVPTEINYRATLNIFKEKISGNLKIATANFVCHTFRILDI